MNVGAQADRIGAIRYKTYPCQDLVRPDLICKPPTGGEDSCRKIIAVLTSLIKFMPTLAAIGLC
ncbi:hypothetical protein [Herbaspirillum frisingense]|uniref:hypothetical protein n=1 Tax=Herbaspirillum frisingense TaxID=92645 RepID=UPI001F2994B2|nr:hypothetical protein [Herbaspirillum frisingense]UIN20338.1 hypothetical protein LAZ82_17895 [Herbaspirillum frisingense]